MPRLRRSDTSAPGLQRVRRGRGFQYLEADGGAAGPADVARIRALVIPPAWTDVWICPYPNGHVQATGLDEVIQAHLAQLDEPTRDVLAAMAV